MPAGDSATEGRLNVGVVSSSGCLCPPISLHCHCMFALFACALQNPNRTQTHMLQLAVCRRLRLSPQGFELLLQLAYELSIAVRTLWLLREPKQQVI